MNSKPFWLGIIGNILKHYDTALFGLLAPFLAPLFFPNENPIYSLIAAYALLPLGLIAKPLGALCFGRISDRFGRRKALSWSLLGMAASTVAIGFLPTFHEIGSLAQLLLGLFRLLQSFFASGETAGGAIYVLENTEYKKRSLMGALFDSSTVLGGLLASGLIAFYSPSIEICWRYFFWAGGAAALLGFILRRVVQKEEPIEQDSLPWYKALLAHRGAFISIVFASGFSYTTYAMAVLLMNGYIPLVTSMSKGEAMQLNTALLFLDLLLLPVFGNLATRYGKQKVMAAAALFAAATSVFLFSSLGPTSSALGIAVIRLLVILPGIAFAGPYHAWALEQVPASCRSTILCLGYTLGTQAIGAPAAACSLWLYHKTHWTGAPALYLLPAALCAMAAVTRLRSQKREAQNSTGQLPS